METIHQPLRKRAFRPNAPPPTAPNVPAPTPRPRPTLPLYTPNDRDINRTYPDIRPRNAAA